MTATRDATIAARVPLDLREDLERITTARAGRGETRHDGAPVDLSTVIRRALRLYADLELDRDADAARQWAALGLPTGARLELARNGRLLDNGRPGTARRHATPTEAAAALGVAPRAGTARRRALECFEAAGEVGLTADEVVVALAPTPENSTPRRVTDLLQGGFIEPRTADTAEARALVDGADTRLVDDHSRDASPVVRPTRAGADAQVYRITGAGLLALGNKRRQEAAHASD